MSASTYTKKNKRPSDTRPRDVLPLPNFIWQYSIENTNVWLHEMNNGKRLKSSLRCLPPRLKNTGTISPVDEMMTPDSPASENPFSHLRPAQNRVNAEPEAQTNVDRYQQLVGKDGERLLPLVGYWLLCGCHLLVTAVPQSRAWAFLWPPTRRILC